MKIYKCLSILFFTLFSSHLLLGQIENTVFYKELYPDSKILKSKVLADYESDIVTSLILDSKRYYNREDFDAVYNALANAIQVDSTCSVCYFQIATLYNVDEHKKIIPFLMNAIRYDHTNIDYLLYLYKVLYINELSDKVNNLLEYAYYLDFDNAFFLEQYYNFSIANKQYDKALNILDKIESVTGSNSEILFAKAETYVNLDKKKKAFSLLKNNLKLDPENSELHAILGSFFQRYTKKYKEAEKHYQNALKIDNYNSNAQLGLLNLSTFFKRKDSERYFLREIIINPTIISSEKANFLKFLYPTNEFYFNQDESVEILKTAVSNEEKNFELISEYITYNINSLDNKYIKELILYTLEFVSDENLWIQLIISSNERYDNYDNTLSFINQGLQSFPKSTRLNYLKGFYYYVNNNLADAQVYLERSVDNIDKGNYSLNSVIYSLLGEIYYKNNEIEKSFSSFDSSVLYDNSNLVTMNNYAYYLSLNKTNLDKAESLISMVIKNEPNNPIYIDTYAWVMFMKKKYLDALFIIEQINLSEVDQSIYYEHYADILYHNGELEKALKYWEKAIEILDEENPILLKKYQEKKYFETVE